MFISRFHGCYNDIYGGQSGDAFVALVGGCPEYLEFTKECEADADGGKMQKARIIHERIRNACQGDAMLATEVPVSFQ